MNEQTEIELVKALKLFNTHILIANDHLETITFEMKSRRMFGASELEQIALGIYMERGWCPESPMDASEAFEYAELFLKERDGRRNAQSGR